MVLRVESSDTSQPPLTTSTSSSLSSDGDIEGGDSSQEENEIVSKFTPMRAGTFARRRSQCEQLSFRQRSEPITTDAEPTAFRRWSGGLPKSIQFCPPNNGQQDGSASSCRRKYHPLVLIALVSLGALAILQQLQLSALRSELQITNQHREYMERTRSNLLKQLATREQSLDQYKHTHEQMAEVNNDMSESVKRLKADYEASVEELDRLRGVSKRVIWSEGRWNKHVEGIRENSKRSVVDRFGKGPHRVELQVQLPRGSEVEKIEIELAPLDMMPHSVHTFLEQVHQGAWDGAAFDAHAGHVLMAHSSSDDGQTSPTSTLPEASPPTVLFPEFNGHYPHDKYTIAFPGMASSSPDFYINLQPNTLHHSPRMEGENFIEGEPCFGRIVDESSRRIVDRMDGLNVQEGGLLEEAVVVVSARILGR
eukprot:CAMPEP_0172539290 /NCGR_PEP_ID=MMETSP1067-20121228/10505_1 /TAXON_ID=265564 ORGANISM="Thalassiosira punctigera, Strain Tpunct2005C2" /NCGR_SAMPLE_ID=MMETSP1067 /ASSEMBLY_ACC=CAM_ASM_000444 /LENGTH=422 /DNA_ID=CAMNT_0013324947 /DNA_START=99 /DNA_END=1367 /DNA_ORIENTATION=+